MVVLLLESSLAAAARVAAASEAAAAAEVAHLVRVRVRLRLRLRLRLRVRFRVRVKARVPQRRHTLGLVAASAGSGALEGRLRGSMYRGPTPSAAARSATACAAASDGLFVGAFGEAD